MNVPNWDELPKTGTFTEAARWADEHGIFPGATADKLRHLARTRSTWPFGEGRPHAYGKTANARTMNVTVLFEHLLKEPANPNGRGPDKKPRAKKLS